MNIYFKERNTKFEFSAKTHFLVTTWAYGTNCTTASVVPTSEPGLYSYDPATTRPIDCQGKMRKELPSDFYHVDQTITRQTNIRYGQFSVRSTQKMQNRNHPDSDFNEIQYIGLFFPKNQLVKVKNLYTQNFSKYDPLKSEGGISRLAITWL